MPHQLRSYFFMVNFDLFHRAANFAPDSTILHFEKRGSSGRVSCLSKEPAELDSTKTWQTFLKSAEAQYGAEKTKRIFRRYDIDPQSMIQQRLPLRATHVHQLEVGAWRLEKDDLKKYFGTVSGVEKASPPAIQESIGKKMPMPCNRLKIAPFRLSGSPSTWSAAFVHEPYQIDQELQLLFSDVGNLPHPYAYLERMCKAVLSRELSCGMIIPAPDPSGKKGKLDYYEIYDVITNGDGLVAYAFKPLSKGSKLEPMVLFRSSPYHLSANDVLETWLNNMQKNIGWLGYQSSRGKLAQLLHDPNFCPPKKRILVGGFSLGGTHAQLLIADHYEKVSHAIFFNDASVDTETAEMFAAKINDTKHLPGPMKVRIFRTKGDVVHGANEKHLFWKVRHPKIDVQVIEIRPKPKLTAKAAHGWRHFDSSIPNNYTLRIFKTPADINRELDNEKRGPDVQWYEKVRVMFGSYLIYPIFYIWSRFFRFIERITGIVVLRHSERDTKK